ncbi:MAG: M23 family metallopeptidase [Oligoflexales bacterium]
MGLAVILFGIFLFHTTPVSGAPECLVGKAASCAKGLICAKINAKGETACLEERPEAPLVLEFPFKGPIEVECTQGIQNPQGTHGFSNILFALDLRTDYARPPGTIKASVDGTVYTFSECKAPKGTPSQSDIDNCGMGFGNYVNIVTNTGHVVLFAHLADVAVKDGQTVKKGAVLGTEGATGQAGHRHLHWQVTELGPSPEKEQKAKPASGRSVPFRFAVVDKNGKRKTISVTDLHCPHSNHSDVRIFSKE